VPNRKDINKCPICNHPKRVEIEDHILKHTKSYRQMWAEYGPCPALYTIHKQKHMPEKVAAAQSEQEAWGINDGFKILECARQIYNEALGSAREARAKERYQAVGACLNPATKVLELLKPDEPQKAVTIADDGFMSAMESKAYEVWDNAKNIPVQMDTTKPKAMADIDLVDSCQPHQMPQRHSS
jgi:hypothetical protein